MTPEQKAFTLEKLEIAKKLDLIIENQNNIHKKIWGDPEHGIVGIDSRVNILENLEKNRGARKKEALNLAIGSFTIALGGAIAWVFLALKTAFLGKHVQ